jgi:hypothetical protein
MPTELEEVRHFGDSLRPSLDSMHGLMFYPAGGLHRAWEPTNSYRSKRGSRALFSLPVVDFQDQRTEACEGFEVVNTGSPGM